MGNKLWTPPSKELLLPPSAQRRQKKDRKDSTDYKKAAVIDPEGRLTYDAYISGSREEWQEQFTAAERQGPIGFDHYMGLVLETLTWRINDDIPDSQRTEAIDNDEAKSCLEFFRRLKDYTEKYLRLKGVL